LEGDKIKVMLKLMTHFMFTFILERIVHFRNFVDEGEVTSGATIFCLNEIQRVIFLGRINNKKLMKGKALRKHSLHEKTAASVLFKLFISGNE